MPQGGWEGKGWRLVEAQRGMEKGEMTGERVEKRVEGSR